jgi:hypothetical protein
VIGRRGAAAATVARSGRPVVLALALALGAAPASGQQPARPSPGDLALVGGRLFDATDTATAARPNPGILVRNGTIVRLGLDAAEGAVGPGEAVRSPGRPSAVAALEGAGATVLRLEPDETVLPGFFDLHAHYAIDLFGEGRVDEYTVNPVLFLANGVTSTFPAGEVDPAEARRGREAIARGERPGPRVHASGPYFGTARPGWDDDAMTPDSIRAEVAWWAEHGARGFKAKGLGPAGLAALIDAAHRAGLTVTGHLGSGYGGSVNPRDAILMGIDRVEHFMGGDAIAGDRSAYASLEALGLDDPETARRIEETVALYRRHGTFFDATLTAYGYWTDHQALDPAVYEKWTDEQRFLTPYARDVADRGIAERADLEQFGRIHRVKQRTLAAFYDLGGGDLITLGTDHPSWGEFLAPFSVHREMHAMVRAGIPPADVLRIATVHGARALGLDERLGTVEVGKYADLVVVRGDPLADITTTRDVVRVVRSGTPYDATALLRSVEGRMGPAGPDEADWWKGNLRLER